VVAGAFKALRISASITNHHYWWSINLAPDLSIFELEHGMEVDRQAHNGRCLAAVARDHQSVCGDHGGYSDLFVPVCAGGQLLATIVVGPFARARLTSADVLERWRALSGRQGHPSDPQFAAYLSTSLGLLVLEGERALRLQELIECFAGLLAGTDHADSLANRADALRRELEPIRLSERTWEAVETMVDERSARVWASAHRAYDLGGLGLSKIADHVLVALARSTSQGGDPVDEAIRRDRFQRRAVDLGRSVGGAIAGRVGDHGVVFLSAGSGAAASRRQKVVDLMERAHSVARREFGLSLHFGASAAARSAPLSMSYEAALAAAESALTQDTRLVIAGPSVRQQSDLLSQARQELERAAHGSAESLPARFDRYLEAVAMHCGYRADTARAHLDVGVERIAEQLVKSGSLDEKSFRDLQRSLSRAAARARTVNDLFAAYRRAVGDLATAGQRPVVARQGRSVQAALDYIQRHYTEPLRLQTVARAVGFAPKYFSRLFKQQQRVTFETYLRALRLERAKQLLHTTDLDLTRVAMLSGFGSSQYFCRVFRRFARATPLAYREHSGTQSARKAWP
jgi:AraC-like DNA-binding protein